MVVCEFVIGGFVEVVFFFFVCWGYGNLLCLGDGFVFCNFFYFEVCVDFVYFFDY